MNNFNSTTNQELGLLDILVAINAISSIRNNIQNEKQSEESKILRSLEELENTKYDKLIEQNEEIIKLLGGILDVLSKS